MADRRIGCLTIFLFVALCGSVSLIFSWRGCGSADSDQLVSAWRSPSALSGNRRRARHSHGARPDRANHLARSDQFFDSRSVSDSMVEDMRLALQQARDDNASKRSCSKSIPGGEVTAADQIYNAVTKARARKNRWSFTWTRLAGVRRLLHRLRRQIFVANETRSRSIGVIIQL